ncbi:hypothetical protein [Bradyrhizobium sp. Ai1a-2]|uniref:hypothetical protein n=1 Tax=Bradyrhizobium sp. Ai1a-2 TaxID=196490 RepID=UPI00048872BC|nr:hypothetical protein [Bradyrhizobium sp. Ai1a-2]
MTYTRMIAVSGVLLFAPCVVKAEPIVMNCSSVVEMLFNETTESVPDMGLMLDEDRSTVTLQTYGTFPLVQTDELSIVFGGRGNVQAFGRLDRVSGQLDMDIDPPDNLPSSAWKVFVAHIGARCIPAKKLF